MTACSTGNWSIKCYLFTCDWYCGMEWGSHFTTGRQLWGHTV